MKVLIPLLFLGLVLVTTTSGQGLFNRLRNFLRPKRQNNGRPFRNFNRNPPPPPPPRFQQSSNIQPSTNFNNNNNFVPNNFNSGPPPAQNNFNSNFNSNPSTVSFRGAANNNNNNNNQNFNGQQNSNRPKPTNFRACHFEKDPKPFCPQVEPNHFFEGRAYVLTFLINEAPGQLCRNFTADEADEYCRGMGARAVSIDTPSKVTEMTRLSARHAQRYFWTGGRMNYPDQSYSWPSGTTVRIGQNPNDPWSPTGGWEENGRTHPQPDNRNQLRDNCEPELCIGVLNNFYADGIKWHDVACHHRKPTICEFL